VKERVLPSIVGTCRYCGAMLWTGQVVHCVRGRESHHTIPSKGRPATEQPAGLEPTKGNGLEA
jgi:hypothetical protein